MLGRLCDTKIRHIHDLTPPYVNVKSNNQKKKPGINFEL